MNHKEFAKHVAPVLANVRNEDEAGRAVGAMLMALGNMKEKAQIIIAEIREEKLMPNADIEGLVTVLSQIYPGFSEFEGRFDLFNLSIENLFFEVPALEGL